MRVLMSLAFDLVLTVPLLVGALVLGGAVPATAQNWWPGGTGARDAIAEELERAMRPLPGGPGIVPQPRPPNPGIRTLDETLRDYFRDPASDPGGVRAREAERRRLETERAEQDRRRAEALRAEQERRRAEAAERAEQERRRAEAVRAEQERRRAEAAERAEQERRRVEAERVEQERRRAEVARAEQERRRQEAERAEAAERQRREEAARRQARLLDEVAGALAGVRPPGTAQ